MKKKAVVFSFSLLCIPNSMQAESEISKLYTALSSKIIPSALSRNEDSVIATHQLARLEAINSMDLSALSETEKEALHDEIVSIQKDREESEKGGKESKGDGDGELTHSYHGGYYISVSLGLLILLLLIILL